ncbi:Alanine--tRNA ligase [Halotydeus destructor]|nr:Alanine--tRNA ligase [Halotydeus destructor]
MKWTSNSVRSTFIKFFGDNNHTIVRSSSVIPEVKDRSLLMVNAGMNQFKPIFLDTLPEGHEFSDLRRAVNSQKCIRVGGKHNDLENVGKNFRHHTFFEMLGNWSFGDYYKREAIGWTWELLTKVFKLDTDRLIVTYFAGDERYGLEPDLETKELWLKLGVAESRVIALGSKDNFWEMGSSGPCGPCTEVHYVIKEQDGAGADDILSRCIEIWNLVFIQYNKDANGQLLTLPKKHVDTGMGLERILSILQTVNKNSNYDTDLFFPLFATIAEQTKSRPYGARLNDPLDIAYRIVADHSRMFTVAIADGLTPGKTDANHKLRKVIRSATWESINKFSIKSANRLLVNMSTVVSDTLAEAYPEIEKRLPTVQNVLREEIDMFEKQIDLTEKKFRQKAKSLVQDGVQVMSGKEAFEFFKKFGAPKELLSSLGTKYGVQVNIQEFDAIHLNEKKQSVQKGGRLS